MRAEEMEFDIEMKDIEGYEGQYAITSCGKVWSYKRKKFIRQWSNGTPYLLVTLSKNGKRKNKRVSRLVAEAYVPNNDEERLKKVDHKNKNTYDNYANNLRWVDDVINYCNRKNNIPVLDVETGEIYCSLSRATKLSQINRNKIIKDCQYYRENAIMRRFVYLNDLSNEQVGNLIVRASHNTRKIA